MSISGYQEKIQLAFREKGSDTGSKQRVVYFKTSTNERLESVKDMPANEHVTMQIAR